MLEYQLPSGHVFYLNNLISLLLMGVVMYWVCRVAALKQYDKLQHIGVCAGLTALGLWLLPLMALPWWLTPIGVLLIGIGKEVADYLDPKKRKFDVMDLLADCIGIFPISIMYLLSFALHNPKL